MPDPVPVPPVPRTTNVEVPPPNIFSPVSENTTIGTTLTQPTIPSASGRSFSGTSCVTCQSTAAFCIIDPVVDESREYLFHSLLHRDAVGRFAFVRGVGPSTEAQPRRNLTGDPFFTDGMRLVVWVSRTPVPPDRAEDLGRLGVGPDRWWVVPTAVRVGVSR